MTHLSRLIPKEFLENMRSAVDVAAYSAGKQRGNSKPKVVLAFEGWRDLGTRLVNVPKNTYDRHLYFSLRNNKLCCVSGSPWHLDYQYKKLLAYPHALRPYLASPSSESFFDLMFKTFRSHDEFIYEQSPCSSLVHLFYSCGLYCS